MIEFFWSCNASEKFLKQITYIICNSFLFSDTWRYINLVIIERLIFRSSCHSGQYETTTVDWLVVNNDISRIPEITHAWLIVTNVYYRSFGKLIKSLPHLEDFKVLVVEGPSPIKVVKTSASSSPANGSSSCSSRFIKYSDYPSSMKELPLLMKIKELLQPSADGVIYLFFSDVDSTGNGNSKQLQFNYIL